MGKAQIISGGTDGLYKIRVDYGDAERQRRLAILDARYEEIKDLAVLVKNEIREQNDVVRARQAELDELIRELVFVEHRNVFIENGINGQPSEEYRRQYEQILNQYQDKINELLTIVSYETAIFNRLKKELASLQIEFKGISNKKKYLNSLPAIQEFNAWCADLTEDATGEVATIEIPGEPDRVLIAPSAPEPTAEDGQVFLRELMSPAQAYFNAAILPGWQKWKPTYRVGVIEEIEGDTCTVNLGDTKSSANKLSINQENKLKNVPFKYLTCDSGAFEVGDEVVVKFEDKDWNQPKVVGFVDNPRECQPLSFTGAVYQERNYGPPLQIYFTEMYAELKAPLSFHNELFETRDEIVCTVENNFWGTVVELPVFVDSDNLGISLGFGEQKISYVGGDRFLDSFSVSMFEIVKNATSPNARILEPCGQYRITFQATTYRQLLEGTSSQEIVDAFFADSSVFKISFYVGQKKIIDSVLTITAQPTPITVPVRKCVYTSSEIPTPSSPWTFSGDEIAIPSGVTWIEKV